MMHRRLAASPTTHRAPAPAHRAQILPALVGLGTALPPLRSFQHETADQLAAIWNLTGRKLQRWRSICEHSGIHTRHGVLPITQTIHLTTGQRMRCYEQHAPPLAGRAARAALDHAGISPDRITDLIIVSCTGFTAPGLDVALCDALKLDPTVRRNTVGFMGCFGAITGLRAAVGACSADPRAAVLVVCAELCSLHVRDDAAIDNQIASALFADGAAAAVMLGPRSPELHHGQVTELARVNLGRAMLLPNGRDWMTWRITDTGFAMTLSRHVPAALRDCLAGFVRDAAPTPPARFIVHPGGPGILDAVDQALDLRNAAGIETSRRVLARCGNMSSATILFVLEQARLQTLPAMLLAFGPGLTIESLTLT